MTLLNCVWMKYEKGRSCVVYEPHYYFLLFFCSFLCRVNFLVEISTAHQLFRNQHGTNSQKSC